MVRETKFRAWDRQGKFWVDERNVVLCPDGEVLIRHDPDDTEWDSGGPIDIVFFTGLHDKNGKEIYEGDVVNSPMGNVEVLWCNIDGLPGFYAHRHGEHWVIAPLDKVEVIGNIHENPELKP